jgi:hypothetical protein
VADDERLGAAVDLPIYGEHELRGRKFTEAIELAFVGLGQMEVRPAAIISSAERLHPQVL